MSCKCASFDPEEGWKCSVTGDRCMYFLPNSKRCAEEYGEGPDADIDNSDKEMDCLACDLDKENACADCCRDWDEDEEGNCPYCGGYICTCDSDEDVMY